MWMVRVKGRKGVVRRAACGRELPLLCCAAAGQAACDRDAVFARCLCNFYPGWLSVFCGSFLGLFALICPYLLFFAVFCIEKNHAKRWRRGVGAGCPAF